ncbi:MAG: hypothetical protein DMG94_13960 [Acidobacteria bacterium]|nr:MAG: hypothetical protein DMG94_13960 [Acidobacteriota bacterium]
MQKLTALRSYSDSVALWKIAIGFISILAAIWEIWEDFYGFSWTVLLCFGIALMLYVPRPSEPWVRYLRRPRVIASSLILALGFASWFLHFRLAYI